MASPIASKAASHSCLPARMKACSRAFWTPTAAWLAMTPSSRWSSSVNRRGAAEAQRADEIPGDEHRHAQRGAQRQPRPRRLVQPLVHVVDLDGHAGREHAIARPRHDRPLDLVLGGDLAPRADHLEVVAPRLGIEQPRRAGIDAQAAHQAPQHALHQRLWLEQVAQLVADLVDQPLLPDQAPVRQDHGAMLERAGEGVEQLVELERLGHEGERAALVRRDRGGDRRAARQHHDLRVRRLLADGAHRVEADAAAGGQIDQRDFDRLVARRGQQRQRVRQRGRGQRTVAAPPRGRRQARQQIGIVVDDEQSHRVRH